MLYLDCNFLFYHITIRCYTVRVTFKAMVVLEGHCEIFLRGDRCISVTDIGHMCLAIGSLSLLFGSYVIMGGGGSVTGKGGGGCIMYIDIYPWKPGQGDWK